MLTLLSQPRVFEPGLGDERVACGRGMNSVSGPVGRRRLGGRLREKAVERQQFRPEFHGEFSRHINFRVQVLAPGVTVFRYVQQKRLKQNDAGLEILRDFFQQGAVIPLEGFGFGRVLAVVAAPCVVDSDHDGHDGRLQREQVRLNAVEQVANAVAADSPVENLQSRRGEAGLQMCARQSRIAKSEVLGIFPDAATVRYTIAREKNPIVDVN